MASVSSGLIDRLVSKSIYFQKGKLEGRGFVALGLELR